MTIRKTATKQNSSPFLANFGSTVLALFLIVAFLIYLLPVLSQVAFKKQFSKITGLPVALGDVRFELTQPEFVIHRVQFFNPANFPDGLLAAIGEVKVRYSPPPPFGPWFNLKRVEINFKDFRLMRNEQGRLNLPQIAVPSQNKNSIDELVLNLENVTFTDLSAGRPAQQTFDLALKNAVYRNIKGMPGILEILNWEILKRTGVEEKIAVIKPIVESPAAGQTAPVPVASQRPATGSAQSEPSPGPSAPKAG